MKKETNGLRSGRPVKGERERGGGQRERERERERGRERGTLEKRCDDT